LIQDVGDGPTPSASPAEVGRVLIADFGLARIFQSPLRSLAMDGDVVTIWYRAPELLLGSKHYTRAIDIWAIGCIFAELFLTRALFPGIDVNQKGAIQVDQLEKIFAVLGKPTPKQWPDIIYCSFFETIKDWNRNEFKFRLHEVCGIDKNSVEFDLLNRMLLYDPNQRITAAQALEHPYFKCPPAPSPNIFITSKNTKINYPTRSQRVAQAAQAHAANANNLPVAWGNDAAADASRQAKRMKI
jgi:cyclin-dependent kinase 8/11